MLCGHTENYRFSVKNPYTNDLQKWLNNEYRCMACVQEMHGRLPLSIEDVSMVVATREPTPKEKMMAVDDGGPAFPIHDKVEHGREGLSIRDYFAGQVIGHLQGSFHAESGAINIDVATARRAYEIADAMIEERKRYG